MTPATFTIFHAARTPTKLPHSSQLPTDNPHQHSQSVQYSLTPGISCPRTTIANPLLLFTVIGTALFALLAASYLLLYFCHRPPHVAVLICFDNPPDDNVEPSSPASCSTGATHRKLEIQVTSMTMTKLRTPPPGAHRRGRYKSNDSATDAATPSHPRRQRYHRAHTPHSNRFHQAVL